MCIHMYYIYYILHTINIIYIHTFMYIHIYRMYERKDGRTLF